MRKTVPLFMASPECARPQTVVIDSLPEPNDVIFNIGERLDWHRLRMAEIEAEKRGSKVYLVGNPHPKKELASDTIARINGRYAKRKAREAKRV